MARKAAMKAQGVPPARTKGQEFNKLRRPRGEYLTKDEVERLCRAARANGRHGDRDATMIWVAFVHGLRVSELIALQIEQYDFKRGTLQVHRVKNGSPSLHTVERREVEALKKYLSGRRTGNVFLSERGFPLKRNAVDKIIERAGENMSVEGQDEPGLSFRVHTHMLRHSCGYELVQQGVDVRKIQNWLGHRNIQHTVGYTALSADAFKGVSFSR